MNRRTHKQSLKWRKAYEKHKAFHKEITREAEDILQSSNFVRSSEFIQHGTMTVKNHCMNVAKYSLALSKKLPVNVSRRELIRGALLHDYFLYDWHIDSEANTHRRLHGFYHPGIALRNASKEYDLTLREKDIIKKHMWPLTIVPPMCREAWIVTMADKYCSLLETLHIHKGNAKNSKKSSIKAKI